MGQKYGIPVATVAKSRDEYQSEAYQASGLPMAPAVMVGDEVVHQGPGVTEEKLAADLQRLLGIRAL